MTEAKKPIVETWNIDNIQPYELNAKMHDAVQVGRIAKSIKEFGWRGNPIVVDKDGVIIAGHGRRLAAIELGMKTVPVVVAADLTEEQVKALRLSDNRAAISDIDTDILQKELASLSFDLTGIFDKKELDFINADLAEIKLEALVDDLDAEVAAQTVETAQKIEETDDRQIPISKALGFKTVSGRDERVIVRFIGTIEGETGKTGADAFVDFCRSYV